MDSLAGIWAVLPLKAFNQAKGRLGSAYDAGFRVRLAGAMAEDVLSELAKVPALTGVLVVSVDPAAHELARKYGAKILVDDATGYTEAVAAAARILRSSGVKTMLVVPGDVPLVTSAELEHLLDVHGDDGVFTLVPSRDRQGTNAVVVSPPDAMELAFGPGSFERHCDMAHLQGVVPRIVESALLALDVDTAADLRAAVQAGHDTRTALFVAHEEAHA
ncbi:2-phospho-L-lactate guanylyltransferase [Rhodoligotrophos appendicifer]|uniref:2-phospho-L-lactate guanylyltransferase n=1 Tax=Rhodoligotrophos appendicifer TaxID=987056 RepID=UPI001FE71DBC|nr:2-phospho-L-lactate guanylyltransferase [Rhodoligotrophos appendicifer]